MEFFGLELKFFNLPSQYCLCCYVSPDINVPYTNINDISESGDLQVDWLTRKST